MSIKKRKIIENISQRTGISQTATATIINEFLKEIQTQYRDGNTIELRGFGTFFPFKKKGRTYKVPKLGEMFKKGKTILKFRSSNQNFIYEE